MVQMPGLSYLEVKETPLPRNPTDVRYCSQHAGANVDFADECGGRGISQQSQAASSVALGLAAPRIRGRSRCGQAFLLWFRNRRSRLRESYCGAA